ncbi:unnamed protein product [Phaeothamnion confervicola]
MQLARLPPRARSLPSPRCRLKEGFLHLSSRNRLRDLLSMCMPQDPCSDSEVAVPAGTRAENAGSAAVADESISIQPSEAGDTISNPPGVEAVGLEVLQPHDVVAAAAVNGEEVSGWPAATAVLPLTETPAFLPPLAESADASSGQGDRGNPLNGRNETAAVADPVIEQVEESTVQDNCFRGADNQTAVTAQFEAFGVDAAAEPPAFDGEDAPPAAATAAATQQTGASDGEPTAGNGGVRPICYGASSPLSLGAAPKEPKDQAAASAGAAADNLCVRSGPATLTALGVAVDMGPFIAFDDLHDALESQGDGFDTPNDAAAASMEAAAADFLGATAVPMATFDGGANRGGSSSDGCAEGATLPNALPLGSETAAASGAEVMINPPADDAWGGFSAMEMAPLPLDPLPAPFSLKASSDPAWEAAIAAEASAPAPATESGENELGREALSTSTPAVGAAAAAAAAAASDDMAIAESVPPASAESEEVLIEETSTGAATVDFVGASESMPVAFEVVTAEESASNEVPEPVVAAATPAAAVVASPLAAAEVASALTVAAAVESAAEDAAKGETRFAALTTAEAAEAAATNELDAPVPASPSTAAVPAAADAAGEEDWGDFGAFEEATFAVVVVPPEPPQDATAFTPPPPLPAPADGIEAVLVQAASSAPTSKDDDGESWGDFEVTPVAAAPAPPPSESPPAPVPQEQLTAPSITAITSEPQLPLLVRAAALFGTAPQAPAYGGTPEAAYDLSRYVDMSVLTAAAFSATTPRGGLSAWARGCILHAIRPVSDAPADDGEAAAAGAAAAAAEESRGRGKRWSSQQPWRPAVRQGGSGSGGSSGDNGPSSPVMARLAPAPKRGLDSSPTAGASPAAHKGGGAASRAFQEGGSGLRRMSEDPLPPPPTLLAPSSAPQSRLVRGRAVEPLAAKVPVTAASVAPSLPVGAPAATEAPAAGKAAAVVGAASGAAAAEPLAGAAAVTASEGSAAGAAAGSDGGGADEEEDVWGDFESGGAAHPPCSPAKSSRSLGGGAAAAAAPVTAWDIGSLLVPTPAAAAGVPNFGSGSSAGGSSGVGGGGGEDLLAATLLDFGIAVPTQDAGRNSTAASPPMVIGGRDDIAVPALGRNLSNGSGGNGSRDGIDPMAILAALSRRSNSSGGGGGGISGGGGGSGGGGPPQQYSPAAQALLDQVPETGFMLSGRLEFPLPAPMPVAGDSAVPVRMTGALGVAVRQPSLPDVFDF